MMAALDSSSSAVPLSNRAAQPSNSQMVPNSSGLPPTHAARPTSEAVNPTTQGVDASSSSSIAAPSAVSDATSTLAEDLKALDVWARDPTTRFEWVSDELQLLQEQQKTLARVLEAREARNREKRRLLDEQRLLAEQQQHQQQQQQVLEPPSPPPVHSSADTPQALRPLENWAVQNQTPMDQLKYEMAMIRAQKSILKKAVRSRQHSRQNSNGGGAAELMNEEKNYNSFKPSSRVPVKEAPGQMQSNGLSPPYDQAYDAEEEQQGHFSMHSPQARLYRQQSQRAEDRAHNAYQQQQHMSQLYNYEDSADGIAADDQFSQQQSSQITIPMPGSQLQFATYTKQSPLQGQTQDQYDFQQHQQQTRPPIMAHHQLQIQLQNQRQKLALRQHQQLSELADAQAEQMRLAEQQTILANGGLPLIEEQLVALHASMEHQFREQQQQMREAHQAQTQQLAAQLQQAMQTHMNQHQPPQIMSPTNQHSPAQGYSTLQQRQQFQYDNSNNSNNNSPFFQPTMQQSPYALNPLSHAPTLAFSSGSNSPGQLTIQPSDPDAVTKLTALLLQQVLSPTNLQAHGLTPMAQAALLGSGAPLPPLSDRGVKKNQQQQMQQQLSPHLSPGSPGSRSLLRPKKQVGWENGVGTGSGASGASSNAASQFPLVSGDLETRSFSADLVIAQTRADAAMSKHVSRAAARQLAEAARLSQIEELERLERARREQDFQKRLMAQRRAKARLEARSEKDRAGELQEELAVTEEKRRKKAERKLARQQRGRGANSNHAGEDEYDEEAFEGEANADGHNNGKLPSLKHVQATVPSHIVSSNPYLEAMLAAEKRRQQQQQSQLAGDEAPSSDSESNSEVDSDDSHRQRSKAQRKKHKRKKHDSEEDSSYDSQDSRSRSRHDYLRRSSHRSGSRIGAAASRSRSRARSPVTDAYLRKKGAKLGPGEGPSNFMKFSDKGQNIHGTFGTFVSDHVLLYGDRKSPKKSAIKKGASSRSRSRRAMSASPAAAKASRRLKKKRDRHSRRRHRSRAKRSENDDENAEDNVKREKGERKQGPNIRVVPKSHARGHFSLDFQRRGESAPTAKSLMDGEEEYANEGFEPISPGAAADAAAAEQAAAAAIIDWDHGAGAIALKQASDFLLMERDATRARESAAVVATTESQVGALVVEQKKMEEVRNHIASTGGDILHTHPLHLSDQLKAAAKLQKKQAAAAAAGRASSSEAEQMRSQGFGGSRLRSRSHSRSRDDSSLPSSVASSAGRLRRNRRNLHRHQPSGSDPQTEGEQTATATEFAPSSSSSSVSPSKYRSASHARANARAGSVLIKPSSQFAAPPRFVRPTYSSDDEKPPTPKIGKRIKGPLPPPPLKPTLSSQKKKNKHPIVKYRDRQKEMSLRSPLMSPSKSTSPGKSSSHKKSNSGLISPGSVTSPHPFMDTGMMSPSMRVGGEKGQLVRQDSVQRKILPDGSEEITTVTTIIKHVKPGESPISPAGNPMSPASLSRKLESEFYPTNVSSAALDTIFDSPSLPPGRKLSVRTDLASPTAPIKAHPVVKNHHSQPHQHHDEEEQAVQQALASPAPISPMRGASSQPHEESSSALDPALLHPPPPERGSLMSPVASSPTASDFASPATSTAPSPSASRPNTKGKQREKLWSAGKAPPARQRSEVVPVKLWDAHATSRTVSQIMKDTTLSEEEKMRYLEEWVARKSGPTSTTDSPLAATPPLEKKRSLPSKTIKQTSPQQQEETVAVKGSPSKKKTTSQAPAASSSKKKSTTAAAAKKKSSIVAGTGSAAAPVITETAPPPAVSNSAARSPNLSRIPSFPSPASNKKLSPTVDPAKLASPSGIKPPNQFFSQQPQKQQPAVAKVSTSTKKVVPPAAAANKYAVNNTNTNKSPGQSQKKKPTKSTANSSSKLPTSTKKREEESKQQHPSPKRGGAGAGAKKNNSKIVPQHLSHHAGVSITSFPPSAAAAEEDDDAYADEGYDNEYDNEFEPDPAAAFNHHHHEVAASPHHITRGSDNEEEEEETYDQEFDNMASAEYGEADYQPNQSMHDEYADEQFIDA